MTPTATYRLQLRPEFPFAAAEEAVPRLARLGVSHLHLSPVLTAVPGSAHGYDVTDHGTVRAELGGEAGLRALSDAARRHGLGLVLDIVPNHMAVPADVRLNLPLWETLREGPGSPYGRWFDVDWAAGGGRMLLPVLAGPLRTEQDALRVEGGVLRYGPHVLPLRDGTDGLPLPELLDAQHYRLAWWRLARSELNYRRFFTVSELIGVRVEDPAVFDATHATVLRLLRDGVADGLRVDHPDGLADPAGYLRRLHKATGGRWTVVEKILARDETLPARWPVDGTTGYDALHRVDGLFTDPYGHAELTAHYREFTGVPDDRGGDWHATVRRAAYKVLTGELAAETDRLTRTAVRACEEADGLRLRDHAPPALRTALREVLVRLPVYRPYATAGRPAGEADTRTLETAAEKARAAFARAHAADGGGGGGGTYGDPREAEAVDVVRDLALGRLGDGPAPRDFAARFAQVSSALRAKAVEDTAFYRYAPLLSACEVGGDPGHPYVSPEEFHAYCARVQRDWPTTATALSTHDTKRSADARAAVTALTECPERWRDLLTAVTRQTARATGRDAPDPHLAWTAWQTAVALGTPSVERLTEALLKAVREAALRTGWTAPDEAYESAVAEFAADGPCGPALYALAEWAKEAWPYVRANQLGMALLQLTMPGVPDLYMGTERPYHALVDPDNRRPPGALGVPDDFDGAAAGRGADREKLRLTCTALRLRRDRPELFLDTASYAPLRATGPAAGHCVAFVRSGAVASVVTRLARRLHDAGGWRGTELPLPDGRWRELLTDRAVEGGGTRDVAELLDDAPVALLLRE
ncbi:malto-oligosyltrehalose synthase [Streptomyces armeniacus]|uniref:Malto-oligosyltrehalose synthase n=1 Tax=Streptomyces armeniacus TaxID=83291 RepID=A0A345XMI0_9ACTN|nr:malto-oligosyltrehalose synthase [Streptomyces armeniacus]AXK32846.1 malto-oligosyltrehalose synthase [Streptomyces armeniacus]